jgi:hypothetical protein
MSLSSVHVGDARRLLELITACGVQPPEELTGLLETLDAIRATGVHSDPTHALIVDAFTNNLRGDALAKRISQASAEHYAVEYGHCLPQRAEQACMRAFGEALDKGGAADRIITSLTPRFDAAATALAKCAALVDPNTDTEQILSSSTDSKVVAAWQAIDRHVAELERIGAVVRQFGCKSITFSLVTLPANLSGGGGFTDDALMCVDHDRFDIVRASGVFNQPGTHRRSPWFRIAAALKLNDIATAREAIRAWAEKAWDALDYNRGRGIMDPTKGFIATPVPNPYAVKT